MLRSASRKEPDQNADQDDQIIPYFFSLSYSVVRATFSVSPVRRAMLPSRSVNSRVISRRS